MSIRKVGTLPVDGAYFAIARTLVQVADKASMSCEARLGEAWFILWSLCGPSSLAFSSAISKIWLMI